MKHYKSVPRTPCFERDINKLAQEGYEFVAFYDLDGITCALMVKEVKDKTEEVDKEKPSQKNSSKDPYELRIAGDPYAHW